MHIDINQYTLPLAYLQIRFTFTYICFFISLHQTTYIYPLVELHIRVMSHTGTMDFYSHIGFIEMVPYRDWLIITCRVLILYILYISVLSETTIWQYSLIFPLTLAPLTTLQACFSTCRPTLRKGLDMSNLICESHLNLIQQHRS